MKSLEKFTCSCGGAVYLEPFEETREIACPKCYSEYYETEGFDPIFSDEKQCDVFTRFETVQKISGKKINCAPGAGKTVTLDDNGVES
jgi:hypothetical protein